MFWMYKRNISLTYLLGVYKKKYLTNIDWRTLKNAKIEIHKINNSFMYQFYWDVAKYKSTCQQNMI